MVADFFFALVKALNCLTQRDDIAITKPDKGSGTVVMDKEEYLHLLRQASIADSSKFTPIDSNFQLCRVLKLIII